MGPVHDDDEDRRQADSVSHDFRIDEVEDDIGDQQVKQRDQKGLARCLGETDEDRWHGTDKGSEIGDERGDAGDQSQRDRVG